VSKFKKEDLKVGDYVYCKDSIYLKYKVYQITKIEHETWETSIWGHWSTEVMDTLPKTVEEFEEIQKKGRTTHVKIESILGILSIEKEKVEKIELCKLPEELLNIDNYKSSIIITLTEMLKDKYELKDFLKILIPEITEISEN